MLADRISPSATIFGRIGNLEQGFGGLVDAHIGRLRRKDDSNEQGKDVDIVKLALGLWIVARKGRKDFGDLDFGGRAAFGAQGKGGFAVVFWPPPSFSQWVASGKPWGQL